MLMYSSCVSGMIENNIDQWDSTYPNSKIISSDIEKKPTTLLKMINL